MDVYTLKSCDTCRKAIKWLATENKNVTVRDIRVDGISRQTIEHAVAQLGWERVLNRRSTSWRQLADEQKQDMTAQKAIDLIAENPTLMKRPLFVDNGSCMAGFDQETQALLSLLKA